MTEVLEREVKIRFADAASARRSIEGAGGEERKSRSFEDNRIFDNFERSLSSCGALLRVRSTGDGTGRLTYKERVATDSRAKVRREWEVGVDRPGILAEILSRAGFETVYRYQKYRTSFAIEDCHVELDETPIGCFVEIEGPEPSIFRVASRLGASSEDLIADDYRTLHLAWLEKQGLPHRDMVFEGPAPPVELKG